MGDTAFWAPYIPLLLSAGLIGGVCLTWWVALKPALGVYLLGAGLLVGQLVRLPLPGQGGGLLVSDIAATLLLASILMNVGCRKIKENQSLSTAGSSPDKGRVGGVASQEYNQSGLNNPMLLLLATSVALFLIYALYVAFLALGSKLSMGEFAVAAAYWLRLSVYLLLLPALMYLAATDKRVLVSIYKNIYAVPIILAMIGFAQYLLMPRLASLGYLGWDPHDGRLVATWLDPNVIGLFFAISLPMYAAEYVNTKKSQHMAALLIVGLALILTVSRSSFIAAAASSTIVLLGLSVAVYRKAASKAAPLALLWSETALLLLFMAVVFIFPSRFAGLVYADATVTLRAVALRQAVHKIIEPNAIVGVGYNTYQFAAKDAGMIENFTIHSRAGTDNSLLTLWATTGAIGLLMAGSAAAALLWILVAQTKNRLYILATCGSILIATAVHSQFVNSALYAHILASVALVIAWQYGQSQHAAAQPPT